MSRWIKLALVTLALAAAFHVAIVEAVPFAITTIFMRRIGARLGTNRVLASPLPTDKSRAVVKPSPDLLYAACIYDVSSGPVRIAIRPPASYWSLSLFARNTDNFFKLSAKDAKDGRAEMILGQAKDAGRAKSEYPNARFVAAPGASGVMLARLLVLDPAHMEAEVAAQNSVQCVPATKGG
jgi:uncharacterized membrane protein